MPAAEGAWVEVVEDERAEACAGAGGGGEFEDDAAIGGAEGGDGVEGAGGAEAREETRDAGAEAELISAGVELQCGGAEEEQERDTPDEDEADGKEECGRGGGTDVGDDGHREAGDDEGRDGPACDDPDQCGRGASCEGDGVGVECGDDPPAEAFVVGGRRERAEVRWVRGFEEACQAVGGGEADDDAGEGDGDGQGDANESDQGGDLDPRGLGVEAEGAASGEWAGVLEDGAGHDAEEDEGEEGDAPGQEDAGVALLCVAVESAVELDGGVECRVCGFGWRVVLRHRRCHTGGYGACGCAGDVCWGGCRGNHRW